jgi:hypothetical protein
MRADIGDDVLMDGIAVATVNFGNVGTHVFLFG